MRMLDIWEIVKRLSPAQLSLSCIGVAVVLAVAFSHLAWFWWTGVVPDGVTVVAGGVALVVAAPMVQMFVFAVFQMNSSHSRLLNTKTKLNFNNDQLKKTRNELAQANESLETRVAERTAELEEALQVAKNASAAKSMFLANMSHELRTPLNGIIGYSEIIAKRATLFPDISAEKIDDYALAIHRSGRHLNAMVDDLLDLSKIEAEQVDVTLAPLRVDLLMQDLVEELGPVASTRGQAIDLILPPDLVWFDTDTRALHQVLSNLLTNALKYSAEGQAVSLAVRSTPTEIAFIVADQGIGMSNAALSKAMEPFARFSDAHIASGESVGLGLSIAKKLAGLLGGRLSLKSVEGSGTTATVMFRDVSIRRESDLERLAYSSSQVFAPSAARNLTHGDPCETQAALMQVRSA